MKIEHREHEGKVWCDHIKEISHPIYQDLWEFKLGSYHYCANSFNLCPYCGAKKPEIKKKKTLAEKLGDSIRDYHTSSKMTLEESLAQKAKDELLGEHRIHIILQSLIYWTDLTAGRRVECAKEILNNLRSQK